MDMDGQMDMDDGQGYQGQDIDMNGGYQDDMDGMGQPHH